MDRSDNSASPTAVIPPPRIPKMRLAHIIGLRLALGLVTLIGVSVIIFGSVQILPGDAAEILVGQEPDPETIALLRRELGLDQDPVTRYLQWISGAVQGNFGRSLTSDRMISDLIGHRFAHTLMLAAYAALLSIPLSIAIAVRAAMRPGGAIDRAAQILSLVSLSSPQFLVGYLVVLIFSVNLQLLPASSDVRPGMALTSYLYVSLLPALTLSVVTTGYMVRMTRAALLDVMQRPFIRMARLKGNSPARVVICHTLPNSLGPIAAVTALMLAQLILGVVVVETVFAYPGLGQLLIDSVSKRDVTVVQGICLIFACVYVLMNLIADLVSIMSNPRILHPKNG